MTRRLLAAVLLVAALASVAAAGNKSVTVNGYIAP